MVAQQTLFNDDGKPATSLIRLFVAAFSCLLFLPKLEASGDRLIEYNRDIRPILSDACFSCHGPDSASRKGDLRLDQSDAARDSGAIIPGNPDDSEMIRRILSDDHDEMMPPPEMKKELSAEHKQVLVDWIRSGAEYQKHWSLIPPQRPEVPTVTGADELMDWPKNAIDHFILKKLVENGLTPNDEADRYTLARRVSLDLTGLPPRPEVIQAFVEDRSEGAYENLVDQLLASPKWGEHRGRYWLDYARYADTHGIHFDNFREMWSYRDWVIRAFNQNMPFDQFTMENLAGDLLPDATLDQKIASGFNRCNMTTNEGGIIDEEYAVLYTRDRTETVAQVWMAMTMNCCVCHSHKFDPISQAEFYQMSAFFNNSTQKVRDGNVKDTPPVIVVPRNEDRARFEELPALIASAGSQVKERRRLARPEFDAWQMEASAASLGPQISAEQLVMQALLNEGDGRQVEMKVDELAQTVDLNDSATWKDAPGGKALSVQGVACELPHFGDFESTEPFSASVWLNIPASDGSGPVCARMDSSNAYRGWDVWVQQRRIGMHIIHSWPDKGLKVVSKEQLPANEWVHVAISYDGSRKASGLKIYINGKSQAANIENDKLDDSTIRTEVPFRIGQRSGNEAFTGDVQDLRIYRRVLSPDEADAIAQRSRYEATLAKPTDQRSVDELDQLYSFWLNRFDQPFRQLTSEHAALKKEEADIRARGTIAHVMNERDEPATAYVLHRGEYDQRREQVFPATPTAILGYPEDAAKNRLGFAKWLMRPDHPLTARVTVNRYWQEIFGTGIVRTAGDFGVSGELPSHPELLDWLSIEFRDSGWDIKKLVKLIVLSATYRQSAVVSAQKLDNDPSNRLLSRGPRFRMDAEMIRDYALAASGLLVDRIGGPSVKPYQPAGVWEAIAMNVSNTRSYQRDSGESLYRRSMYTFVKRMAPPASMDIFNAPSREFCVVRRERTNTPLQALATLNDEQMIEAARHLAQQLIVTAENDVEKRWDQLAMRVLCREFHTREKAVLRGSLKQLSNWYQEHSEEAAALVKVGESVADPSLDVIELATWTMICNEVMNLDEVVTK
ncbi:MAG: DUF1553 domain-containing protein [Planctomycetaceae bacterium]